MDIRKIDFTQRGGMPLDQQLLEYMQTGYNGIAAALRGLVGDNVIINGVEIDEENGNVSDGWIICNGELMPFVGGKAEYIKYFSVVAKVDALQFEDTTTHNVLHMKYAKPDMLGIPYESMLRLEKYRNLQEIVLNQINEKLTEHTEKSILTGFYELKLDAHSSSVSTPLFGLDNYDDHQIPCKYYYGRGGALENYVGIKCYSDPDILPMENWQIKLVPRYNNTPDFVHLYANRGNKEGDIHVFLWFVLVHKNFSWPVLGNRAEKP